MRICVFCGSAPGRDERYLATARHLGALLAEREIGLVYGGASVGTMGAVADAALEAGGEVIGVIPRSLADREVAHRGLPDLRIVANLHERKAQMAELSDAFVTLPGGIGTMEELFEIWTWAHLGLHDKPVGALNTNGFYRPLRDLVEHMTQEGFLPARSRDLLMVDADPASLVDRLTGALPVIDVLAWAHTREGRMLAARTRGNDQFYLPGGKREVGESDSDAVAREVKEETGVRLSPATITPLTVVHAQAHGYPEGTRVRLAAFSAESDGEPTAHGEIAELAWLGYAERERCAPGVRIVMDELHARGLLA